MKKTGKSSDRLLKSLEQLDDEFIEVGHFKEQGNHSDSPFTYPQILSMWQFGVVQGHEGTVRSPLMAYAMKIQNRELTSSPEFKSAMNRWSKNALKPTSDDVLLEEVGRATREQYKAVFGVVGPHMPPDSTGTPMLETGELREATGYRTSKNKSIRE